MLLVKHLTEVGEGKQVNYYLFLECTGNNRHTAMAIHLYLRLQNNSSTGHYADDSSMPSALP